MVKRTNGTPPKKIDLNLTIIVITLNVKCSKYPNQKAVIVRLEGF